MQEFIKIGLIDDEALAIKRLQNCIDGIPGYQVVFAETNPLIGLRLATQRVCDILITDIQMGKLNGLLICEQMEEIGLPVIICSAFQEYALPSISVSVSGYLLKPVELLALKRTLEKVTQKMDSYNRMKKNYPMDYLFVEDYASFGVVKIRFQDLMYIEQKGNYSFFQSTTKEYKQRSTLQSIEKNLQHPNLVRIHKSFLVNIEKVTKIFPNEVELENGKSLPLGRTYEDNLNSVYRLVTCP